MAPVALRYEEEALVASFFFDSEHLDQTFAEFSDDDCFYADVRLIARAARNTRPLTPSTLFAALGPDLDSRDMRWEGLEAESLIVEMISKFAGDVEAMYGPYVASRVHQAAERRRTHERAQRAAQAAANDVMQGNEAVRRRSGRLGGIPL